MITPDQLICIGGSRWQKGGKDRVYFNGLCDWYGLELEWYRSGNISDAWVDGERISNSRAFDLQLTLQYGKFYFENGKFYGQNLPQPILDRLVARVKAKLAEQPAPAQSIEQLIPEGYIRADCGHIIERIHLMNASLGQTCPDCYDRYAG